MSGSDRHMMPVQVSRRRLFVAGSAGMAGISLADILRAEDAAVRDGAPQGRRTARAIINVHLDGGPPQMDTIDMKPDGPAEVRGEFAPIATCVPGIRICELMPGIAALADRFAFVRSLVGSAGAHDAFQCQSGFPATALRAEGGWPAMGSALSRLWGSPHDLSPTFCDLMQGRGLVRDSARPGFLGRAHAPFRPDIGGLFDRPLEEGMKSELAARGAGHATPLVLASSLPAPRLDDRRALLDRLDAWRRRVDAGDDMRAMDRFHEQAVGILTSGRVAEALDLDRESSHVRDRYRLRGPEARRFTTADGAHATLKFLLARRLVEAGVRCVSISLSDFDTHGDNFPRMRHLLPILDAGLSALVGDLEARGLLDDVAIVVWGEFGRTPRINAGGGRDHWPAVSPALLVGGGIRGGQVIGETDRWAGEVLGGAVTFQDVTATLYHLLGLDPHRPGTLTDTSGRPHALVETGRVIDALV
ncbi:MAG TPA: DUF1501 domain-containing protein [Planctomycetaceae bacterium]|nr:DUF1501 domain-containing protein [Planctomycetaceae bacterium]